MAPFVPRSLASSLPFVALAFAVPARAAEPATRSNRSIVQIESDGAPLEIHDQTDEVAMVSARVGRGWSTERAPIYAHVCHTTPCSTALDNGVHRLALSRPGGPLLSGDAPVLIDGPSRIDATYVSRDGVRTAGAVTLAVGIGAGLALEVVAAWHSENVCSQGSPASPPQPIYGSTGVVGTIPGTATIPGTCAPSQSFDPLLGGIGLASIVVGTIAGTAMLLVSDAAHFTVTPLSLGAPAGVREGAARALPNGLALTMRF
jgi:hypothetical protein